MTALDETPGVDSQAGAGTSVREEVGELPAEIAGVATAVRKDIEGTAAARFGVRTYLWMMDHAPASTRGKIFAAAAVFMVVFAPSTALLYWTLAAGADATEAWFSRLGYFGVFLSNLASTATVFIPVPGLTAAAQALIVSTSDLLNPLAVGVLGGLGMAVGEVTAYVAGMAGAEVARETEMRGPRRLQPAIDWTVRRVDALMHRFGIPTLFVLAAVPNPFFEFAGITAGATRMGFWKFMAALTPGKITRGLLLAFVGERIIFG